MTSEQLIFYGLIGIIIVLYIRRQFMARGISNYSPAEAKQRIEAGSVLLDVRSTGERRSGSIAHSLHIPLYDINARIQELEKHRSKEIICYCATGSRSVSAASKLKKAGFAVGNLKGGISAWNFSNL